MPKPKPSTPPFTPNNRTPHSPPPLAVYEPRPVSGVPWTPSPLGAKSISRQRNSVVYDDFVKNIYGTMVAVNDIGSEQGGV